MQKNIILLIAIAFMTGCGGDSVSDGSIGPRSSDASHISTSSLDSVTIEAVKSFNLEGVAVDIALSEDGRIAYIASGDAGLEVVDVSSPSAPHLIYSYDLPEYANYVEVKDDVVYVAYIVVGEQSYQRVDAFDVYNPYRPQYIGSSESQNGVGHNAVENGAYLYQVGSEGLEIFQTQGRSYEKVGSYYLHDSAYALALHDNYVFIANGRVGLTILKTNVGGAVGHIY